MDGIVAPHLPDMVFTFTYQRLYAHIHINKVIYLNWKRQGQRKSVYLLYSKSLLIA